MKSVFDSLPDGVMQHFFTFFKPSELNVLAVVSKKWNSLVYSRFTMRDIYKRFTINAGNKMLQLSDNDLKRAIHRLENSMQSFEEQIKDLPYWFGNIDRKEAERILLEGSYEPKSALLRACSQKGYIAMSCLEKASVESKSNFILDDTVSRINFHANIAYNPAIVEKRKSRSAEEQKKFKVRHVAFLIFRDESDNNLVKIKNVDDDISKVHIYNSVADFNEMIRRGDFFPIEKQVQASESRPFKKHKNN